MYLLNDKPAKKLPMLPCSYAQKSLKDRLVTVGREYHLLLSLLLLLVPDNDRAKRYLNSRTKHPESDGMKICIVTLFVNTRQPSSRENQRS